VSQKKEATLIFHISSPSVVTNHKHYIARNQSHWLHFCRW